jgi:hypothetical protein
LCRVAANVRIRGRVGVGSGRLLGEGGDVSSVKYGFDSGPFGGVGPGV